MLAGLAGGAGERVPVVTARSAGGSELIDPDVGLVLDDSEDHTALATTLRRLTQDSQGRRTMARRARALAKHHTWRVMAGQYIDLLQDAAQTRRRRLAA